MKSGLTSQCRSCRNALRMDYERRHPEKRKEWCDKNHNLVVAMRRTAERKRNNQRKNVVGSHTNQETWEQFKRQRGTCFYCGLKLRRAWKDGWHEEHVMPKALGGNDYISNIVVACAECNLKKRANHPIDAVGMLC